MTQETEQDAVYTLKNGVKLRLREMAPALLAGVSRIVGEGEPKPPVMFIKEKEREEENPNDPTFVQEYDRWQADASVRMLTALVMAATTLEEVPEEMMGPESPQFATFMRVVGIPLDPDPEGRYVQWVVNFVLTNTKEMRALTIDLMRKAGALEEDVAEYVASFRGDEERNADNGASSVGNRRERRASQRAAQRPSARDGGA